jgi:lysine-specific permease
MIAIGGSIGTGLFLASGGVISMAGPGGGLTAYVIVSVMVYFLMTSLGEMATYMPVSGSFETYATRFLGPSLGFSLGWNYWFNWAVTLAAELVAGSIIMQYWFPNIPGIYFSIIFFVFLFILNYTSARSFGEAEYWFAGIKVTTTIVFIFCGILMIIGVIGGRSPGFSNWMIGDAPFVGGFSEIIAVLLIAGFSFQGTELVGIAAGESDNPEVNVPKAISSVFWRILIFYIGSIAVIGFLIPYTNPNLLCSDLKDIAVSPFTLVFRVIGIPAAANIMNGVILTAVLSAGNSSMYASTRMIYAMAKEKKAPSAFGKVNKNGVPVNALFFTALFGALAFLTSILEVGKVYVWLINLSALLGFIAWLGIAVSHYRFRMAFRAQGKDLSVLKYKAKWFPFGPLFSFLLCIFIILGQNYQAFITKNINWMEIISTYSGIILFIIVFLYYKIKHKTKLIPLKDVDLTPIDSM